MQTLAAYFLEHLRNNNIVRFWFEWAEDLPCEYCYIKNVLVDSDGDLLGLMLTYDNDGYKEYYPLSEIKRWAFSEDDQEE
jgi:hypothetical protein